MDDRGILRKKAWSRVTLVSVGVAVGSWVGLYAAERVAPGAVAGGMEAAQVEALPAPASSESARTMLDSYCVTCHNDRRRTADVSLEGFAVDDVAAHAELSEKVLRKLRGRAMPPPGRPRPDEQTYEAAVAFFGTELDNAARANPNPGRSPDHRLNRTEYGNAIRDLLGFEIDSQVFLPHDDASFGFDNIAEVLSVSPTLLERYMRAARHISQLAVGDPHVETEIATYSVPQMLLQDERMGEELPFGSAGGLALDHHFPVDGEYVVKVRLQRNFYGYIRGLIGGTRQIEIRMGGERIAAAPVGGMAPGSGVPVNGWTGSLYGLGMPEWENYMLHSDDGLEFRFAAKAGPSTLAISFTRDPSQPEGVVQPRVTGFGFTVGEGGVPGVDRVIIEGPFNGTAAASETVSRRKIFVCRPESGDTDDEARCAGMILSALARLAYRRPVTVDDLQVLLRFYERGRQAGGFEVGVQRALERLLVDPEFLFRIVRDPADASPGAVYRLTNLELASRLSFFLWSSIPDDELLRAAEDGTLSEPAVLEAQVQRMLRDDRSRALGVNFVRQWLETDKVRAIDPDAAAFPDFTENLRKAFQRETELFIEAQLLEDRSVVELLNADYTFVNQRLADHYGIPNVYGSHFRRVELGEDSVRRGLLGQGSVLMVTSYANRTSPVLRGKWLLGNILGTPPPPPPPNVPALPERGRSGEVQSVRERLSAHRENPVCGACHNLIDPLGFALENFDAVGEWRAVDEAGKPIDASGSLVDGTRLDGPQDLRSHLLDHDESFVEAFTEKLLTYALGRGIMYFDRPWIREIVREAETDGYRWSSVVLGIVESRPFRMRKVVDVQKQTDTVGP